MQGQFHIDMATAYIDRRDEELATDRVRRHARAQHHGPSPGIKERVGLSLIHFGMRFVPDAGFVRVSRPDSV
jgi:hypothetical protein